VEAKVTRDTFSNTLQDAAEAARTVGTEILEAARTELGSALEQAKEAAKVEAELRAEAGRNFVAGQVRAFAARMRAEAASDDGAVRLRLLEMVSAGTLALSDDFQRQSLSSLLSKTENFAHRNPGAFIAGAALAGFAATRFGRARDLAPTMEDDRVI
jgi:hypothetical protein